MPILPSKMECYISPSPPSIFVSVYAPMKCLKITHKPTQLIKLHMYIYIYTHTNTPCIFEYGAKWSYKTGLWAGYALCRPGPSPFKIKLKNGKKWEKRENNAENCIFFKD